MTAVYGLYSSSLAIPRLSVYLIHRDLRHLHPRAAPSLSTYPVAVHPKYVVVGQALHQADAPRGGGPLLRRHPSAAAAAAGKEEGRRGAGGMFVIASAAAAGCVCV